MSKPNILDLVTQKMNENTARLEHEANVQEKNVKRLLTALKPLREIKNKDGYRLKVEKHYLNNGVTLQFPYDYALHIYHSSGHQTLYRIDDTYFNLSEVMNYVADWAANRKERE